MTAMDDYGIPSDSKLPSNIKIRPARIEDAVGLADCFYSSFYVSHLFWTIVWPPSLFFDWWVKAWRMGIEEDRTMRTFVACDTDLNNKIVGFTRWRIPQSDGNLDELWPDLPTECDMSVLGPFFEGMHHNREELNKGQGHWFLQMLGTSAEYQGKGIGETFVQWGCDIADKEDKEVYIDASEKGAPFYQKHFGAVPRKLIPIPEQPNGFKTFTYISHVRPRKSERAAGNTIGKA